MNESRRQRREERRERFLGAKDNQGQVWGGVFLLLIGLAALANNYIPGLNWLFSWPMFLIALGLFIGLRNKFNGAAWLALIIIGSYFLATKYFTIDADLRRLFWPFALIGLGAYLIFRPKRKYSSDCVYPFNRDKNEQAPRDTQGSTENQFAVKTESNVAGNLEEEILDVASVFAAVKKNVYSKNFKGGEIVSVFGGAEVNLSQASFQQTQIIIESVQVFGGAKLIVPADWVIHNEAVAIFGGIEDKRPQPSTIGSPEKVLVLKGFVMFGGIEIKSY